MANFCTACGRSAAPGDHVCRACGEPLDTLTIPPLDTGARVMVEGDLSEPSPAPRPRTKRPFQWGWAFKSAGLTFLFIIILAPLLGKLTALIFQEPETIKSALAVGSSAVAALSLFLGSALASYFSPGRTIYEPAVGVALAVVLINLISVNFEVLILGWIIPFGLGVLGAKAGEHFQEKGRRGISGS